MTTDDTPAGQPRPPASDTFVRNERRGLLALVAGATCIGFAPIWVRWAEAGPVATAFHRLLFALPFLGLWALRDQARRAAVPTPSAGPDRTWAWIAGAGICFALDMAAWHLSIRFTSVANATLLANFAPLFVTFGAWLFLRERVPRIFFVGLSVAFGGAWLLTGAHFQSGGPRLRGDLLGLVTALFYGGYQLGVARLRRTRPAGVVLFASSLVCTPLLWLMAVALGETIWPRTANGWAVALGLALTAQVLGQGLITSGFAHLPASYSSLTLLVQPFVAALAGWLLVGEPLRPVQIVGALLLLAGLMLARRRSGSAEPRPPAPPCPEPIRETS